MTRFRRIRAVAVVCMISCFALASCSRPGQPEETGETKPAAAQPKDIWVSEKTGKEYKVTVENDVVRAAWTNIAPVSAGHGAFIRSECKRQGSKWVGTSTSFLPCTTEKGPNPRFDNWCHWQTKFEIDSMTPDRIAGRAEAFKKFDCAKCKILDSEMKDFLWTPKNPSPKPAAAP